MIQIIRWETLSRMSCCTPSSESSDREWPLEACVLISSCYTTLYSLPIRRLPHTDTVSFFTFRGPVDSFSAHTQTVVHVVIGDKEFSKPGFFLDQSQPLPSLFKLANKILFSSQREINWLGFSLVRIRS